MGIIKLLNRKKKSSILNKWTSLKGMQNILVDENNKRIYNYEDILVKYFNTQNEKLIRIIRDILLPKLCCINDSIFFRQP